MGLDEFVCDELHWAVRETLRAAGAEELTLMGWCIGATLCAMYCGLDRGPDGRAPVRNLVLLTMPIDGRGSNYANWVGDDDFDVDAVAEHWRSVPGGAIDFANKMLKPVTNFWTTYRRLWDRRAGGHRPPRGLPDDGQVGGRQPAVPGPRLGAVDSPDVPRRALLRGRYGCAAGASTCAGSIRTCWSSPPAPTTSRRARDDADLRSGLQPGRHPLRPPGRPHRADRRLDGPQGALARHRRVAGRALRPLIRSSLRRRGIDEH